MKNYESFYSLAENIIKHPKFLEQKNYIHHNASIFNHAIEVAFVSYKVALKLKLDVDTVIRGALLHDFFLYDWHIEGKRIKKRGFKKHGFTHAKIAHQNALKYFSLNKKEEDIILKHMFPLNFKPPRYKESWLVNIVDTYITFKEYFKRPNRDLMNYIQEKID